MWIKQTINDVNIWSDSFEIPDLKLLPCSRLSGGCAVSMWFLASLLASPRSPEPPRPRPPLGSLFSFIRRLLRMSLEAAEATLDRDLVLARRNKSEKFTRFTSFESPARRLLELDPSLLEVASLRGSSGILLSSVFILRLESLTSVFFMMNSSATASSFGSSTNSIS